MTSIHEAPGDEEFARKNPALHDSLVKFEEAQDAFNLLFAEQLCGTIAMKQNELKASVTMLAAQAAYAFGNHAVQILLHNNQVQAAREIADTWHAGNEARAEYLADKTNLSAAIVISEDKVREMVAEAMEERTGGDAFRKSLTTSYGSTLLGEVDQYEAMLGDELTIDLRRHGLPTLNIEPTSWLCMAHNIGAETCGEQTVVELPEASVHMRVPLPQAIWN